MLPTQFIPCVDYVYEVLGADWSDPHEMTRYVAYAEPDSPEARGARICIIPSSFFGDEYGRETSLPTMPLQEICGVPLLYGSPRMRMDGKRLIVHADIIASAYFLVSRYEEIVRRQVRDEYGRFPGKRSLPYRAGFLHRPVVDEYAHLLREWLRSVGVGAVEPRRRFSVLLTHDVDSPWLYSGKALPGLLRSVVTGRRPVQDLAEAISATLGFRKDPYYTFDDLVRLDSRLSHSDDGPLTKVTYFFMAGSNSEQDSRYDVHSRRVRRLTKRLMKSDAAIGLHPGLTAGSQPDLIASEKSRLEDAIGNMVTCSRHHYLRLLEPEHAWHLQRAGLHADSTLGYPDIAGFRLGVCRPVRLFDPVTLAALDVWEHPLIVMDGTLYDAKYMGLPPDQALNYCIGLIDETRRHGGEFVALWHNSAFYGNARDYHTFLYTALIDNLSRISSECCVTKKGCYAANAH